MRFKKSIIILMGVVLLSTAFSPAILNRNSSSKPEFSASVSTLNPRSFQPQPFKQRQLDFDIFGYRVNPIDTFPITRDEQGTLHLEQLKKGYLNIKIDSRFGFFYFNSIIVEQEIYIDLNSEFIQRYEIEDPLQGFFSEQGTSQAHFPHISDKPNFE